MRAARRARPGPISQTAQAVWRAIGFPDLPDDLPAFTDSDVETLRVVRRARSAAAGVRLVARARAARRRGSLSSSLARVADSDDRRDRRTRSARPAPRARPTRQLAETLAERVDFEAIARAHRPRVPAPAAGRDVAAPRRRRPGRARHGRRARSASSTSSATRRSPRSSTTTSSARWCRGSATLAHDTVVGAGGRIVKTIGDEVMFVTDTAATAARDRGAAHRAVDRATSCCPRPAPGSASGRCVAREGDYFGPVVNLAAASPRWPAPGTCSRRRSSAARSATTTGFVASSPGLAPASATSGGSTSVRLERALTRRRSG